MRRGFPQLFGLGDVVNGLQLLDAGFCFWQAKGLELLPVTQYFQIEVPKLENRNQLHNVAIAGFAHDSLSLSSLNSEIRDLITGLDSDAKA